MAFERRPPYDAEAEQGTIGSIILDPTLIDEIRSNLPPDCFFMEENRILYRACIDVFEAAGALDPMLLRTHLLGTGEFETVGGSAYLIKVMNSVATPAHVQHYSAIVTGKRLCTLGTESGSLP